MPELKRCTWPRSDLDVRYHDEEWGVPVHDDVCWFEFLTLEGAQAGLSWSTILKKRETYRKAFANWDVAKVAQFTPEKQERLLQDEGIIRNRLKIQSTISNARAFLSVQEAFGSFDKYIWRFVNGAPIQNRFHNLSEIPARTPISDAMSKDLLRRGFRFVGSTICYALMQATGLVNDHLAHCFRYLEISRPMKRP
jgi:DNA-3-methyladenine glycosylase I